MYWQSSAIEPYVRVRLRSSAQGFVCSGNRRRIYVGALPLSRFRFCSAERSRPDRNSHRMYEESRFFTRITSFVRGFNIILVCSGLFRPIFGADCRHDAPLHAVLSSLWPTGHSNVGPSRRQNDAAPSAVQPTPHRP